MERHLKKTKKTKLNRLGLERLNQHRRAAGLPPLELTAAPDGEESVEDGSSDSAPFNASPPPQGGGAGGLPSAVDNSLLPSFPPVRNQGSIGSCASFSTTYYAASHMLGLARGFNNKNDSDNSTKLSPKWTYPMVNGGQDNGSWFTPTFDVLLRHGAATWADWPYSGLDVPSSYREWCRDGAVWRRAIHYRMAEAGTISGVHTAAGLNDLKTLLADGYVLLYATDIYGWRFTTISDDPATSEDNGVVGKRICSYVEAEASGHAMTVVGYNDNIWCDINKNGVVDNGEKGALRICNSWGASWLPGSAGPSDGGFTWLAYDALRTTSIVPGASTPNRAPGNLGSGRSAWWYNEVYWLRARNAYTPELLAQFTLSHGARSQLQIRLGRSTTTATTPATTWTPGAWQNQGGAFAFDGTSTAGAATFVVDLSDIAASGLNRYYLTVSDSVAGNPASITDFRITDAAGTTLATAAAGIPGNADNSSAVAYGNSALNPPVIQNGGSTNLQVGATCSFTIQASGNPTSFGAEGLPPGLTINTTSGLISGVPTAAGTFVASLSASSPSGTGSGSLSFTITGSLQPTPEITSATTASGTVGAAFSYTITADGAPTSFGAAGLPVGLGVNTANGLISGTPAQAGTFPVQLSANNAGGTGNRALSLTINPPPNGTPVITSPTTVEARAGSFFSYRIIALNNPTSFGAEGLPAELTFNAQSGVISGTPTLARDHTITLRASNASGTGFAMLLLSVVGDSSFGPANDAFANRAVLAGTNTVFGGNNNATAETGEPAHALNTPSRSVWWTWTAPGDGHAAFSTEGSDFDTVLAIYTGESVSTLTAVASDDESGPNHTSRATFTAVAGTAYAIALDGYGGAVGNIALSVVWSGTSVTPVNDAFANRLVLPGASFSTTGGNINATAQAGEPPHAGSTAARSLWWSWTATQNGAVQVSTAGSDFDTVLALYTGTALNALTPVASDDQSGGNDTSRLVFNATAGTTYQIAVDGYHGASGNIVLSLQPVGGGGAPPNDNFANRIILNGSTVLTTGANIGATSEVGEPGVLAQPTRSVWWSWTAGAAGLVTMDTSGSSFDTVLTVYTGSALGTLTAFVASDDADATLTSRVSFQAAAGETYQIAVDGFGGASGNIQLHLLTQSSAPANDAFANADVLTGSDPAASANNVSATAQAGEPAHAGNFASRSVWWSWTAPSNGLMTLRTAGSTFDTVLAVYTGTTLAGLNYVASNDDGANDPSSTVQFWAAAGTTYRIAIDGYLGAMGTIRLSGHQQPAGDFLYSTDFESFYDGADALVGVDGWLGLDPSGGVQGTTAAFTGMGRGAYLGYNPPNPLGFVESVTVYRPVNFQPVAQGRPIVTFATTMAVMDSDNGHYDYFAFSFFNRSGQLLAGIILDNQDLSISWDDRSGTVFDTGWTFPNNASIWLVVTIDFGANTWSATLGNTNIFSNRRFHAGGRVLDLGDISLQWFLRDPVQPGNNYLLFDNYGISATTFSTPPTIISQPVSRTNSVGSVSSFSVVANSAAPLRYQWQFNGASVAGATNSNLSLLDVNATQAGPYRVLVSNAAGSVLSQAAVLTVVNQATQLSLGNPRTTSRGFEFRISANPGRTYLVESSTNLVTWSPVTSLTMDAGGSALFLDNGAGNRPRGFYRVRSPE